MATAKEREEFLARMVREYPDMSVYVVCEAARKIMRHARTHGNLAVEHCNEPSGCWYLAQPGRVDEWEERHAKREVSCERRITELCAPFGLVPHFGGDPRGYTVKLKLPSGAYNTCGGSQEGYGVPQ
jgi:hypothetical protein